MQKTANSNPKPSQTEDLLTILAQHPQLVEALSVLQQQEKPKPKYQERITNDTDTTSIELENYFIPKNIEARLLEDDYIPQDLCYKALLDLYADKCASIITTDPVLTRGNILSCAVEIEFVEDYTTSAGEVVPRTVKRRYPYSVDIREYNGSRFVADNELRRRAYHNALRHERLNRPIYSGKEIADLYNLRAQEQAEDQELADRLQQALAEQARLQQQNAQLANEVRRLRGDITEEAEEKLNEEVRRQSAKAVEALEKESQQKEQQQSAGLLFDGPIEEAFQNEEEARSVEYPKRPYTTVGDIYDHPVKSPAYKGAYFMLDGLEGYKTSPDLRRASQAWHYLRMKDGTESISAELMVPREYLPASSESVEDAAKAVWNTLEKSDQEEA